MKTVILEVRSLADTLADAAHAMKSGRAEREARIGFATPELLWQVLTAKRWELLKAMCGAGAMSIREAARRVGRDVKGSTGTSWPCWMLASLVDRQRGALCSPLKP